ncbi:hypothetical protein [Croceivirga thetidis]|uniref:Lipoprotein n=1 Tax=Croceivirga thetidis TaxID=2721623 RepID=A0ABX1GMK9_9FLAO|nr:hypothetical protein [Croceivirga thetidis]NKI31160.1 hypothetical protein [Croceivirga thetidis]
MKNSVFMSVIMVLSFLGCSPQKKLVSEAPVQLGAPTCQAWVGGMPESGSGMLLTIPLADENLDAQKLQQAYFRGKVADIKIENTADGWMAKANFLNGKLEKPDITMDADAAKEVGNQPPSIPEKFPFELAENECVISFLDGETIKYFKLSDIKELKKEIRR